MDVECFGHSGHEDGPTVDDGTAAGLRPPLRAMVCLLGVAQ
jgi:hypothetical protein